MGPADLARYRQTQAGAAGYDTVHDPQLGRTLNLDTDVNRMLKKFDEGIAVTRELTAGEPSGEVYRTTAPRRRSWWWRRR